MLAHLLTRFKCACAVVRILDVPEDGSEVAVVGTLYKDMKLKPSILDEYAKDRALTQALGEARTVWRRRCSSNARWLHLAAALPPSLCWIRVDHISRVC